MKKLACALFTLGLPCALSAQDVVSQTGATEVAPLVAQPMRPKPRTVLPANTQISLSMNETVTTKGKRWNEGDTFDMTVTHDVMLGQYVVIPRGVRGVGRITYLTNKGAFGKSGKMEIDIEYVELGGRQIPVSGHYRQEGEGNTVGTVAGVVAAGVFAGFVTGHSGVIPQGRELTAYTRNDLPVAIAGPAPQEMPVVARPVDDNAPALQPEPSEVPKSVSPEAASGE